MYWGRALADRAKSKGERMSVVITRHNRVLAIVPSRPSHVVKGLFLLAALVIGLVLLGWNVPSSAQALGLPTLDIRVGQANSPEDLSQGLQILILLTVLTLAPAFMVMTTAFTRIVIVLSLARQAIGSPQLPPNQVVIGFSLILTFFVMTPTFSTINETALKPYLDKKISQQVALDRSLAPIRQFMFKQTDDKDLALFVNLAKLEKPKTQADVPTYVLLPAFVISELKTAFQLGFVIFLPFLIIDMVVSSILVSMGMLFLPPITISLPFKIVLFVLVDGWHLLSEALVLGFG